MIVRKPEAEKQLGKKLKGRKTDWFLLSSAGTRKLGGPYRAREDAVARERQVQFFKHRNPGEKAVGGLADWVPDTAFDPIQLRRGIKVELEHTSDQKLAKEIAKDHLTEDPEYYEKLAAIEGESSKYRLEENPSLRKVAELHPDDRAILGSAVGSAAAYMISPAIAPLGAAAGHVAAKRLGRQPRRNPSRSLSDIALDIRRYWRYPWQAGPEDRIAGKIRDTVEKMSMQESPRKLIGDFLSNAGGWHGNHAIRIKDELRKLWKQTKNPQLNPKSFEEREHNWNEVLIQKDGKKFTRKQIKDYYWKNRKKIWPFLKDQTVLVIMASSKNKFVLMRKRPSDDKYIKLTKLNGVNDDKSFEYWINRRVIEFHPVITGNRTPLFWVDIDIHAKSKTRQNALKSRAKKAFPKLRRIMRQFGAEKIYAYDSGIGGFHLEAPLKRSKNVDKLRKDFTKALKEAFADDPIFTTGIAKSGQIRLDTTTMHTLGSLRAPYSFTVAGGIKKRV